MGNCGVGFAPAVPERHQWLIELMEGVEDIPGSAMVEGITWDWESFPEYLDALERKPHVIDFGTQIAHGALRAFVMGDRGANNEVATADDIAQMSKLTEEALRAGALGFSTSRTPLHRSKSGELVPGTNATPDELYGIADAMKRVGHGIFQFSPEHTRVPIEEWPWMQELARRSGATVSVNVNQLDDGSEVWRKTLALLTQSQLQPVLLMQPPMRPVRPMQPPLRPVLPIQPPLRPVLLTQPPLRPVLWSRPPLQQVLLMQPPLRPVQLMQPPPRPPLRPAGSSSGPRFPSLR
jgi:N-acyl-D-aspartate/D-glutamate deacylase